MTSDASVAVTATADDALAGLQSVTCNGVQATVTTGNVACTVPLRPERNAVVVHAKDLAGNTISKGVNVTRIGTSTRLVLSPDVRTLLVDETASLSLTNDFGMTITGATWTSSDPAVVSVSTDDPPVLTALAAGTSTITAIKNSRTATAAVTVVAGATLADGTTRWSVAPTPGLIMAWAGRGNSHFRAIGVAMLTFLFGST